MDAARTVGLSSCVICRRLITDTWNASFDAQGVMSIHEVPHGKAFINHNHERKAHVISTEMPEKELPGDEEIKLKLKDRGTLELFGFQRKLRQPRYKNNPQALAIRYHLVAELLTRRLMSADTFDPEVMSSK